MCAVRGVWGDGGRVGLGEVFLSHPVCFPFLFSLQHPLFSSLFPGETAWKSSIFWLRAESEAGLGPKSAKILGQIVKMPGISRRTRIPGKYPATAWVFCRFPQFCTKTVLLKISLSQFCLRFCPRPALRLRETREFPEWSTKHPLFSLGISGNAKCWGPSVFLLVCRKTSDSPTLQHVHVVCACTTCTCLMCMCMCM